jgi:hypothetical protein
VGYRHFLVLGTAVAALIAAPACGSDGEEAPHSHGGHGGTSSTLDCEGRGEQFSAGMAKQAEGGSIQIVLKKSDVAPPAQGLNTWTLEITDANGQPVAGADVQASSKMPDHTHPATKKTGTQTEPGTYEIVPYFSMTGYWETTVTVTPQGGTAGSVMFGFCIPQ